MRLLRFGPKGAEKPGLLDAAGRIRDLSGHVRDITPDVLAPDSLARLAGLDPSSLPQVVRRSAPRSAGRGRAELHLHRPELRRPRRARSGQPIPDRADRVRQIGQRDQRPERSGQDSARLEEDRLGGRARRRDQPARLVRARRTRRWTTSPATASANDVSEREFQLERGGTWYKGKSSETFAPFGPWLVTKDEVPDPHNLKLWLEVDGHRYQNSSTAQMIFNVPQLISYMSHMFVLLPGDVIATGTPPGVGAGVKPEPVFLKPGNVMRLGIDGLGEQRQEVVAAE